MSGFSYTHVAPELVAEVYGISRQAVWKRAAKAKLRTYEPKSGAAMYAIADIERLFDHAISKAQIREALRTTPNGAARL